ncbi:MAG: hypothetical protein JNL74_20195, partial [Fibrobacteres bacterium]|nr:hypothetical protein [Fibrobacterota bacterium]
GWTSWLAYSVSKSDLDISVNGEGLKKVQIQFRDKAGNSSAIVYDSTIFDVSSPASPSILITDNSGFTKDATPELTLSAASADSVRIQVGGEGWSTWLPYATSISNVSISTNGEGLKYIYAEYKDLAGNISAQTYDSTTYDVSAPSTLSLVVTDNSGFTKDGQPDIAVAASGADSMSFKLESGGWSSYEAFNVLKTNFDITAGGDGLKRIYVRFRDLAGNESDGLLYDSTMYDNTMPSLLSIVISDNQGYTKDPQPDLTIGATGADSMAFKLNTGSWSAYEVYSTSKTNFDISAGGQTLKKVYIRFRDLAGNVTTGALYDSTVYDVTAPGAPSVVITDNQGYTNDSDPVLTISAVNADSMHFKVNTGAWTSWEAYNTSKSNLIISATGNGEKFVFAEFKDMAGNLSAAVYDSTVFDTTLPSSTALVITDNYGYTNDATPDLTITATGADSMSFKVGANPWSSYEPFATAKSNLDISVGGEGLKTVDVRFRDIAGNVTVARCYDSTVYDIAAPATPSITVVDNQDYTRDETPALTLSASGADSMRFQVNGEGWSGWYPYSITKNDLYVWNSGSGLKRVYVEYSDLAGNISAAAYDSVWYDTTSPAAPSIIVSDNQGFTKETQPVITLSAVGADSMRFQVNGEGWSTWEPYAVAKNNLNIASNGEGEKFIYVEFRDMAGNSTSPVHDSTIYDITAPTSPSILISDNQDYSNDSKPDLTLSALNADSVRFNINSTGWTSWISYVTSKSDIDISGGSDGMKFVEAEFRDKAGNLSAIVHDSMILDRVLPASVSIVITDNQGFTSDKTPDITLNATGADSMAFSLDNLSWSPYISYSTSMSSFDISAGGNGSKKIYVRYRDIAGNVNSGSPFDSTYYDTSAPVSPAISVVDNSGYTNDSEPDLTISASGADSVRFRVNNEGWSSWMAYVTAKTDLPINNNGEGLKKIYSQFKDIAGNVSDTVYDSTQYDISAPTSLSIAITDNSGYTNAAMPAIAISAAGADSMAFSSNGTVWSAYQPYTTSANSYDITSGGNGIKKIYVKFRDLAGNYTDGTLFDSTMYDATAPTVVVSSLTATPTKISPIPVTVTFSEDVLGFTSGDISVVNGTVSAFTNITTNRIWNADITPSSDGAVIVTVPISVVTDSAGNANNVSNAFRINFDATAPIVTVTAKSTRDQTPTVTGTINDPGATISVTVNGQTAAATNNGNGTWILADNILNTLPEAVYDVQVTVVDSVGNIGTDATLNELRINLTAPIVTVDAKTTNDQTPSISGTVTSPSDTVRVTVAGQTLTAVNLGDGTWTIPDNLLTTISEGIYDVEASANDTLGNVGDDATTAELKIDITLPVVTVTSKTTNDQTPALTGTINETSATIWLTVGGQTKQAVNNLNGIWTLADNQLALLAENVYDIAATATDSAGNIGVDATVNELNVDITAPTVSAYAISDNSGYTADVQPDINITVTGADSMRFKINSGVYSTWESYSNLKTNLSIAVGGEGAKNIYAEFKDVAGNVSTEVYDSTNYDITSPVPVSLVISDVNGYSNDAEPDIAINATGADSMAVKLDNGIWSAYVPYNALTSDFAISAGGEGLRRVYVRFRDLAGNATDGTLYDSTIYDVTPPSLPGITISDNQEFTNDNTPTVALTAGNADSMRFNVNTEGWSSWIAYAASKNDIVISVNGEGLKKISIEYRDIAGNAAAVVYDSTTYDVTTPSSLSFTIADNQDLTSDNEPDLTIGAVGADSVAFNLNGSGWTSYEPFSILKSDFDISAGGEGLKKIAVRFRDKAGNVTDGLLYDSTWYDHTAPASASIAVASNAGYTSDIKPDFTLFATDADSMRIQVNGEGWSSWIGYGVSLTDIDISVNGDGLKRIYAEFKDDAGNITSSVYDSVTLDRVAPDMLSMQIQSSNGYTTDATPLITIAASNADSMAFNLDNNGWSGYEPYSTSKSNLDLAPFGEGIHRIQVRFRDLANNVTDGTLIDSVIYDVSAPTAATLQIVDSNGYVNASMPLINITAAAADSMSFKVGAAAWSSFTAYAPSAGNINIGGSDGLKRVYVKFKDIAGNVTDGTLYDSTNYDATVPTVTLSTVTATPSDAASFTLDIVFSEKIAGFDLSDLTLSNCTASALTEVTAEKVWTAQVAPTSDGPVSISIGAGSVRDYAWNVNSASTVFVINHDATAPLVTVNRRSTRDQTPSITGTINDPGASIQVTVNGQTVAAVNQANGLWILADNVLSTLPEAVYDVAVAATDSANNVGADTSVNELRINLTAPVVTVDSLITNDTTPSINGTINDPFSTVSVTIGSQTISASNNGNGTWTLADNLLLPLAGGKYDVSVTATDTLGNFGNDETLDELTIDTTAPVVTIAYRATADRNPALSGTINDAGAGIMVSVGGQNLPAVNYGNGTWRLDDDVLAPLDEGVYDVIISATDLAGNVGHDLSVNDLRIDTTAPAAASIAIADNYGFTSDSTPSLTLSATDADSMRLQVDSEGWSGWMAYAVSKADLSIAQSGEGSKRVYVQFKDIIGNTASAVYDSTIYDVSAPTATAVAVTDTNDYIRVATPHISLSAVNADSMRMQVNGEGWSQWFVYDTGKSDFNVVQAGEGLKRIYVEFKDLAGNVSVAVFDSATFDTTAPTSLTLTISDSNGYTNDATPYLSISASVADSMAFRLDTAAWSSYIPYDTVYSSLDLSIGGEGLRKISVRFKDNAGNVSGIVIADSSIYDTTSPIIALSAPAAGCTTSSMRVSYSILNPVAAGSITWTRIDGSVDGSSPHVQSLTGSELDSGLHNSVLITNLPVLVSGAIYDITLNVRDTAGNTVTSTLDSVIYDFTIPPLPVTALKATSLSRDSIALSWIPSVSVNAESLVVVYRTGSFATHRDSGIVWSRKGASVTADTLTGLNDSSWYFVSLFVKNSFGIWSLADTSAQDSAFTPDTTTPVVVPTPDTIPPANVTALRATALTRDSIALSWTPSLSADAESLVVVYRKGSFATHRDSGTVWTRKLATATSDTITGLNDSSWYFVSLFVQDTAGNWSLADTAAEDSAFTPDTTTPVVVPTPDTIPPANVTALRATALTRDSIALSWTPSLSADAESLVVVYRKGSFATHRDSGTVWARKLATTNADTIIGLNDSSWYFISLF